jgi:outer membrane protease
MRFSFTGKDGFGKYAREKPEHDGTFFPIDYYPTEYTFSGEVIHYTQDWLIATTGLAIGIRIFDRLTFDLSFQISPFTLCIDKDEHLTRDITFIDNTSLGLFIEPRGKVSYSVEWFEVSFELAHRSIGLTRGEVYIKEGDGDFMLAYGTAGAGLSIIDTCLLVRVRL